MKKFNFPLAVCYALCGAFAAWGAGCVAAYLCNAALGGPFGTFGTVAGVRPRHYVGGFYMYLAVFGLLYGIFLLIFLMRHPREGKRYYFAAAGGAGAIITVGAVFCGMIYRMQERLSDGFPAGAEQMDFAGLFGAIPAGWTIVLWSVPFNMIALVGFFQATRRITVDFDAERTPRFWAKLTEWNRKYPNQTFLYTGTILFVIVLGCGTLLFDYDRTSFATIDIRLSQWFILGMVLPVVEGIAFGLAFLCWAFKFIRPPAAWAVLFGASILLGGIGIWNALPQNNFSRALHPIRPAGMRLEEIRNIEDFRDGTTIAGKFYCPDARITRLKMSGLLDQDGVRCDNGWPLTISRVDADTYTFIRRPPPPRTPHTDRKFER